MQTCRSTSSRHDQVGQADRGYTIPPSPERRRLRCRNLDVKAVSVVDIPKDHLREPASETGQAVIIRP